MSVPNRKWTSKLGNKYDLAWIQERDGSSQRELKRLRSLKDRGNHICADCGRPESTWASITHGVFICVTCSDVHRSVGTHVTKVKGCTGTYLWGPDELGVMQERGNAFADRIYGSKKVSPDASKEEKQKFVMGKYSAEKLAIAGLEAGKMPSPKFPDANSAKALDQPVTKAEPAPTDLFDQLFADVSPVDGPAAKHVEIPCDDLGGLFVDWSIPADGPVSKEKIPDSLLDELFADWSAPVVQAAPTVKQVGYPSDATLFPAPLEHKADVGQIRPMVKTQPSWGALDKVDDIFAELNAA